MNIPFRFKLISFFKTKLNSYIFSDLLFKKLSKESITFLQIGANNGVKNDLIFKYNDIWNGVLVEPIPSVFETLKRNYSSKKGDFHFENVAVSSENGKLNLYIPKGLDVMSSANYDIASSKGLEVEEIEVKKVPLDDLIAKYFKGKELDLLVLDVEGHELEILNAYSFSLKPKALYIEIRFLSYNEYIPFYDRMINLGYNIYEEGNNCLFVLKS